MARADQFLFMVVLCMEMELSELMAEMVRAVTVGVGAGEE